MLQILLFFAQGIPEIAGVVALSLVLAKVKLRWKIIMVFASILTILIYILRSMPVIFGLHTLAGIFLITLFIARTTQVLPSTSFIVSFVSFALLALLEVPLNELFSIIFKVDVNHLISDSYKWMFIGLSQAFIIIAVALSISKHRKPLEGMWKI